MKKCLYCNKEKSFIEFHKNKRMKDGYSYYCKECKSIISKNEYIKHKDKYLENVKKYRQTDYGKKVISLIYKRQKEKFPEKYKARTILNNALLYGKVLKPEKCCVCNEFKKLSAHHNDYNNPLDVLWMCYSCHTNHHFNQLNQPL